MSGRLINPNTGMPYTAKEMAASLARKTHNNMSGNENESSGFGLGLQSTMGAAAAYKPPAYKPAAAAPAYNPAAAAGMGLAGTFGALKNTVAGWMTEENAENKAKANAAKAAANAAARAAAVEANIQLRAHANPYGAAGVRYANGLAASQHQGQGAAGLAALTEGIPAAAAAPPQAPLFGPAPGGGGGGPLHPGVNHAMRMAVASGASYMPGRTNKGGRRKSCTKNRRIKNRRTKNRRTKNRRNRK